MTRTERAMFPRAIIKDRSESKSGMDKSLRKSGAGPHNWGSLKDELDLERDALEDERIEAEDLAEVPVEVDQSVAPSVTIPIDDNESIKSTGSPTEDEVEKAREIRAKGFKGDIDLSAIARSSAGASTSPPKDTGLRDNRALH